MLSFMRNMIPLNTVGEGSDPLAVVFVEPDPRRVRRTPQISFFDFESSVEESSVFTGAEKVHVDDRRGVISKQYDFNCIRFALNFGDASILEQNERSAGMIILS